MRISLILLLLGLTAGLALGQTPEAPQTQRAPRQRTVIAQSPRQVKMLLRKQIETWHRQASTTAPSVAEQVLKEKLDVVDLEIMIADRWPEVTKLLLMEIRSPTDPWEKTFATRGLLALLDLADTDQLARLDRQLVQAYLAGPQYIHALPKPEIVFPPAEQEKEKTDEADSTPPQPSEAYLRALRQAKDHAESRNAQDERIMYSNQLVSACEADFTAMLIRISTPLTHQAIIRKLTQQLNTRNAAFAHTVQALQDNPPIQMDRMLAKSTLNRLQGLANRFAGPRDYITYTQVHTQTQQQSSFAKTKLDFYQIIQPTLEQLFQQSQGTYRPSRTDDLPQVPQNPPASDKPEP